MTKKKLLRVLFAGQVVIFVYLYLFGTRGVRTWHMLQQQNDQLASEIETLRVEIEALDAQVADWLAYEQFYTEKLARERYQMARPGDHIFYT